MTDKELKYNTGAILRKLRLTKDITQLKLSEAARLSKGTYQPLEAGKTDLRLSDAVKLADYYGIQPYLLTMMICEGNIAAIGEEEKKLTNFMLSQVPVNEPVYK